MKRISIVICLFSILNVFSEVKPMKQRLIYSDDFKNGISNWIAEFENPETSSMKIVNGKLDVSSSVGATVWFKSKLSDNLLITYDETIIDAGGPNDRVSDMNVFWMASDPSNQTGMIKRDGKFSSYDNLNLYYAGIGGHYNKYTRFRKYTNDGNKPILQEYTDLRHLLVGNKKYTIKIIVKKGLVQYYLNDELFWDLKDNNPYKEGYFGFRTTISHQQFENFKVFQIN
jgi:hypothetical protein